MTLYRPYSLKNNKDNILIFNKTIKQRFRLWPKSSKRSRVPSVHEYSKVKNKKNDECVWIGTLGFLVHDSNIQTVKMWWTIMMLI